MDTKLSTRLSIITSVFINCKFKIGKKFGINLIMWSQLERNNVSIQDREVFVSKTSF